MAVAQTERPRPVRTDGVRADVPVIELKDVTKVYEGGAVALDRVSLRIGRGEFAFVVGPTGCGKSSLMRLLMKEMEPTQGDIFIAGRNLGEVSRKKVPRLRRNIGVIFQDFKLLPNRTVYQNVAYSLQVIGENRQSIRRKVPEILRLVGLSTKLHSFPDQLSGGEQQRVSIARAFVNHPPLLLADEPTGNLDPETSIGIMQLIYRINRTGTTVLVATHDKEMVDKMRRRVIELSEGRVIRDDESGLYRPDESTAEFAMRVREELGYGKEVVRRTKKPKSRRFREELGDATARRFREGLRDRDRDREPEREPELERAARRERYSEEKVRRHLGYAHDDDEEL